MAKPATSRKQERIICHLEGTSSGPTIVFFGGIHGNEPAGIVGLQNIYDRLKEQPNSFHGRFYGIAGNLTALEKGVRFIDEDLNRIWHAERFGSLTSEESSSTVEEKELHELAECIQEILDTTSSPHYFIDLHTTSGSTPPFVVMNDSLLNRRFTSNYPLPIILGIEEYLTGALLSHLNEMGYVTLGFESGQHDDYQAIINAENFIDYTLGLTGFNPMSKKNLEKARLKLKNVNTRKTRFYEIYHQHLIEDGALFKMLPGFNNFQHVPKNTSIAMNGSGLITTSKPRQLFMPLYQDKGAEGFYFIRRIPLFSIWLSKKLRVLRFDGFLARLPGINWASPKKNTLLVDKRVTRILAKPLFHILGYRARTVDKNHWVLRSRDKDSRDSEYKKTGWN